MYICYVQIYTHRKKNECTNSKMVTIVIHWQCDCGQFFSPCAILLFPEITLGSGRERGGEKTTGIRKLIPVKKKGYNNSRSNLKVTNESGQYLEHISDLKDNYHVLLYNTNDDTSHFYSTMLFTNCFYGQHLNNPIKSAGNSCI